MPKLLWMSQNNGQTWRLVASGDLPTIKAPFTIPQGYPTGVVALASGQLILSLLEAITQRWQSNIRRNHWVN